MSAYRDALSISSDESGPRLELAIALIEQAQGVVVLDGLLALRPESGQIQCEVICSSSHPSEIQAAVAKARLLLASASIHGALSRMRKEWVAVEDYGSGTVETWRASQ